MTRVSLCQRAYRHLQQRILSGDLPAGAVVSELSLAKEIGIGRTPVREAIRQLQLEGLVEQVPRYGTIVCKPGRQDLIELYQVREALEPYAVGLAAERISGADLAVLEKLCDKVRSIAHELRDSRAERLEGSLLQLFLSADMAFHMLLIRAAGSGRIVKIVGDTRMFNRIFGVQRHVHDLAIVARALHFHRRILRAVKKKDAEEASRWTALHIRTGLRQVLRQFDQSQADSNPSLPPQFDLSPDVLDELRGPEPADGGGAPTFGVR